MQCSCVFIFLAPAGCQAGYGATQAGSVAVLCMRSPGSNDDVGASQLCKEVDACGSECWHHTRTLDRLQAAEAHPRASAAAFPFLVLQVAASSTCVRRADSEMQCIVT